MTNLLERVTDLFKTREESNIPTMDISEFLTRQYLDNFFTCSFPEKATPLTDAINKRFSLPKLGDHLITPRTCYFHHGIYVGNERVVHYSGLSKGLNLGTVEDVTLNEFRQNRNFQVKPHPNCTFSPQVIVQRAKSRLSEKEYNLVFNNCEHFVNWCIYNVSASEQVITVGKVAAATGKTIATTIKTVGTRYAPHVAMAAALADTGKYLRAYLKGDISKEKLFEEISHAAVTTTSAFYYASLGQAAIPIPVVGAVIGAGVGYVVGNMLAQSGLVALGDSQIVKVAKERRHAVQTLCDMLIPEIRKSRIQFKQYVDKYFYERSKEFDLAFNMLDNSLGEGNPDKFIAGLERINNQFGSSLQFNTFDEFDRFMESNETLRF